MLSHVDVEVTIEENGVRIVSSVSTTGPPEWKWKR